MKILITGGTGFIGSRLALRCLERGDSVSILGQENTAAESQNRRWIEEKGAKVVLASVTEREKLSDLLIGCEIVYHLAAAQHEMNVPDQRFWEVNVQGTKNILEASIHAGVRRFIHGSTIGVYGALQGEITERSPCAPDNIYGLTKLEGERLVVSYRDRLPVVIIRIPEVYGPGDRRLLKLFKAISKGFFPIIGKGKNHHHLIYIDDLLEGLILAAGSKCETGETFLLAGKEAPTTNSMVAVIAEELKVKIPKIHIPFLPLLLLATLLETVLRPMGIQPPIHRRRLDFFKKSFLLSGDKAAAAFGFQPRFTFHKGVFQTAHWYKKTGYL